jgi:hypothetical protein
MQKYYFYETMKNDGIFIFLCLQVNISYGVFMLRKIIHMGPRFLRCHDDNFYFISNASEYAMQKINMDNYRVTS